MTLYEQLLQLIVSGISVGAVYVVVGLGFMIIYSVTRVVNFSQGEFVMLGGMITAMLNQAQMPLPLAMVCALVITVITGLIVQRAVIHPARGASVVTLILLTFGVSVVIRGIALLLWGTDPKSFAPFSGRTPVHILAAVVAPQALWVLVTGIVVSLALHLFFEYTSLGKALRACAVNTWAARLMGINPERMALLAFALAAAMGALAGIVMTPWVTTNYAIGIPISVKGFIAALAGGLDRIDGVVLGGLALGILEQVSAGFISSGYKDGTAILILMLLLFLRPRGLLGSAEISKV